MSLPHSTSNTLAVVSTAAAIGGYVFTVKKCGELTTKINNLTEQVEKISGAKVEQKTVNQIHKNIQELSGGLTQANHAIHHLMTELENLKQENRAMRAALIEITNNNVSRTRGNFTAATAVTQNITNVVKLPRNKHVEIPEPLPTSPVLQPTIEEIDDVDDIAARASMV